MSHYIFVWAWAGETRSVKHVVTPVLLEFHPPVRPHPRDRGHCAHRKDFRRFGGIYPLGGFALSSSVYLFNKKADLPSALSKFYARLRFISSARSARARARGWYPRDGYPRMCNKRYFYRFSPPLSSKVRSLRINILICIPVSCICMPRFVHRFMHQDTGFILTYLSLSISAFSSLVRIDLLAYR